MWYELVIKAQRGTRIITPLSHSAISPGQTRRKGGENEPVLNNLIAEFLYDIARKVKLRKGIDEGDGVCLGRVDTRLSAEVG